MARSLVTDTDAHQCETLEMNPGRVSASLPHTTGFLGRWREGSGRALAYYLRNVWGKVLAHPEIQFTGEPCQEGQCPNLEWRNFWNLATLPCHLHARSQRALCCLWLVLYPLVEIPRIGANLWSPRLRPGFTRRALAWSIQALATFMSPSC